MIFGFVCDDGKQLLMPTCLPSSSSKRQGIWHRLLVSGLSTPTLLLNLLLLLSIRATFRGKMPVFYPHSEGTCAVMAPVQLRYAIAMLTQSDGDGEYAFLSEEAIERQRERKRKRKRKRKR